MATREEVDKRLYQQRSQLAERLKLALKYNDETSADLLREKIGQVDARLRANTAVGNVGNAMQSGLLNLVTFPADLAIMGRNLFTGEDLPSLHETLSNKLGIVTKPQSEEGDMIFRGIEGLSSGGSSKVASAVMGGAGALDAAMGDTGATQGIAGGVLLAAGGWKAMRDFRNNREGKKLLEQMAASLPKDEGNALRQFMLTGQGSDSPLANAAIQRLKANPKYTEVFTTLEKAATEATLKKAGPTSSIALKDEERAKTGVVGAITEKINALKENQRTVGTKAFEAAYRYGGDNKIADTTETLKRIRKLRSEYEAKGSPDSEKAAKFLADLEEKLSPTGRVVAGEGTTVTRAGTPDRNIPGSAGYTTTAEVPMVRYDSLGLPIETSRTNTINIPSTKGTTVSGTPDVTMNIPGREGYEFSYGDQKMTVGQLQGWLSEFGAKASNGGNLFGDLALSSQDRIMKNVFAALKDDLKNSLAGATGNDRKALASLNNARTQVADASAKYNEAVAQGLPKWLKDTPLRDVDYTELFTKFKTLSPTQRELASTFIAEKDPEALNFLNRQMYNEFVSSARGKLADGTYGVDLSKLVDNWKTMPEGEKRALTTALGVKAADFEKRMNDAAVFTRRMEVQQPTITPTVSSQTRGDLEAVAGATGGYQAGKVVRLATDALSQATTPKALGGFSDDQLMKLLLNKDAGALLKSKNVTPFTKEALDALDAPSWATSAVAKGTQGAEILNRPEEPVEDTRPPLQLLPEDTTMERPPLQLLPEDQ